MKYRVTVNKLWEETGFVDIEAKNRNEAQLLAADLEDNDFEWDSAGMSQAQDRTFIDVTELPPWETK